MWSDTFVCWRGGYFYFRVFGYGLHIKDERKQPRRLWSERNGIWVQWKIGRWLVTPLKRGQRGWYRHVV